MTRRVGLIGWPVAHSPSPAMHNAAFAALGMDWEYVALPARAGRLGHVLEDLRVRGLAGANVTVPHKQAVMAHLDRLSDEAAAIGAVNTIGASDDGTLAGSNTDAAGFLADLRDSGVEAGGGDALVLGTGGSARAVVHALCRAGARSVTVLGRRPEKARELADSVRGRSASTLLAAEPFPAALDGRLGGARLVVNCTPLGMRGHEQGTDPFRHAQFTEHHVVYDLVYGPAPTPLLEHASACGARALGGIGMLVRQGALSFEIWTGVKPPLDVMRRAAENALGTG